MTNNEVNFMLPNRTHSQCAECSVIERLKSLNEHGMCLDRATCFARVDHDRLSESIPTKLRAEIAIWRKSNETLHEIRAELDKTIKEATQERDRWINRVRDVEGRLEAVRVAIQPAIGASKS